MRLSRIPKYAELENKLFDKYILTILPFCGILPLQSEEKPMSEGKSFTASEVGTLVESLRADFKVVIDVVAPLPGRLAAVENRLERLETRVESVETSVGSIDTKVELLTDRLGGVETKLERVDAKVELLTTKFEKTDTKLDLLTTKVLVLTEGVLPLPNKLEKVENELGRLGTRAGSLEDVIRVAIPTVNARLTHLETKAG